MDKLQKFFPLVKVDVANRLVYGLVTAEYEDKDGETCHYDSTKPEYESVNQELGKASDGANIMPLREMHQLNAVGAGKSIDFDDSKKQIRMAFKVVDDSAWKKVQEKVLLGFSQGGTYLKRWTQDGKKYYTAKPGEVSLVDNPCLPGAFIEYAKADGTVEMFKTPVQKLTDDELKKITDALRDSLEKKVKYLAGEGHLPYTDDSGKPDHRHMGAAWAALHGGYRGNKYEGPGKEEAIAHLKEIYRQEGMEPPSSKALLAEFEKFTFSDDSELDTGLVKISALVTELMGKLSAQGENMNPEQIKKCATALGISEAEFQKQFLDEGKPMAKGHSMAALHAAIEKAHSHHEDMMAMHEKMGKAHAAMATHLGKCMKACKGLMGTEEESEKAVKALMDELKIAPVETEEEKIAKAAAEKAKGFTTTNHELAALIKAEVEKGVKEAVDKLPKNDESDRAQLFAVRRGELEKSKAAQPSNDSIPV